MTDLLPCPFCGSTNLRFQFAGSQGYIECNECGTEGPCDERAADPICDIEAAYDAWNRRAALAEQPVVPMDKLDRLIALDRDDPANALAEQPDQPSFAELLMPPPSAALAEQPVGATDEALASFSGWFCRNYPGPDTIIHKPEWHAPKVFRAAANAIARWGTPAIKPPADGEVAELVEWLHEAVVASARLSPDTSNRLARAATLLQRHPTPIPVAERLPGPGEWVWHCYAGVRLWELGRYNGRQFFIGDGPESQPATHWLPANDLPVPPQ